MDSIGIQRDGDGGFRFAGTPAASYQRLLDPADPDRIVAEFVAAVLPEDDVDSADDVQDDACADAGLRALSAALLRPVRSSGQGESHGPPPDATATDGACSLVDFLLKVDSPVQSEIIRLLLEKLPELFDAEAATAAAVDHCAVSLGRRILRSLCWLPAVAEPQQLSAKLLEILHILPLQFQQEVLELVPEMVSDVDHKLIAAELKSLMDIHADLLPSILATLSQLKMPDSTKDDIVESVLGKLASADAEQIPGIVKFLFTTANQTASLEKVCIAVRRDLQLAEGVFQRSAIDRLLNAIEFALQSNPMLKKAWLKLLADEKISALDFLILVSIVDLDPLFALKVIPLLGRSRSIADLDSLTKNAPQFFQRSFKSLLKLGNAMLSSASIDLRTIFGIFDGLFGHCVDYRQEIMSSLVANVGCRRDDEICTTLATIQNLLRKYGAANFASYRSILKSMLDYIDDFSYSQANLLYVILFSIGFECSFAGDHSFLNELYIMIRKQISHPLLQYCVIGVAGIIGMAMVLPKDAEADTEQINDYTALLRLTVQQLSRNAETMCVMSLFNTEMANAIEAKNIVSTAVIDWIYENIALEFQDLFIEPLEETSKSGASKEIWLDHDGAKSGVAVKIYPCIEDPSSHSRFSADMLCSLFDLLQASEKVTSENGNLDSIDGLLGCGIQMFDGDADDNMDHIAAVRQMQALFALINWLTTLVNTFAKENDHEMHVKCAIRLNQIPVVREKLDLLLDRYPVSNPRDICGNSWLNFGNITACGENENSSGTAFKSLRGHFRNLSLHAYSLLLEQNLLESLSADALAFLYEDLQSKCSLLQKQHSMAERSHVDLLLPGNSRESGVSQLARIISSLVPLFLAHLDMEFERFGPVILDIIGTFLSWCKGEPVRRSHFDGFCRHVQSASHETDTISFFLALGSRIDSAAESFLNLRIMSILSTGKDERLTGLLHEFLTEVQSSAMKNEFLWALRAYLGHCAGDINSLKMATAAICNPSDGGDPQFQFLTDATPSIVFPAVLEMLVAYLQRSALTVPCILDVVKCFHLLIGAVKVSEKKVIILASLKLGKQFIEAFAKFAVPVLDENFRKDVQTVNQVLKTLQQATRILQSICGYSKEHRDVQLAMTVPLMKKTLEAFIFTVKAMLNQHGVLNAFWVGNLKHRNLRGEVIASQIQYPSSSGDDESTAAESDDDLEEEEDENVHPDHIPKRLKLSLAALDEDGAAMSD